MFDTRTRLFFFACQKDAAGAALKRRRREKKISSGSILKVAAPSGSAILDVCQLWMLDLKISIYYNMF